jgi:uncharacterized paraquat-inducible protein A
MQHLTEREATEAIPNTGGTQRVFATHKNWVSCDQCGKVQAMPKLQPGCELLCVCCNQALSYGQGAWREKAAALVITGAALVNQRNIVI